MDALPVISEEVDILLEHDRNLVMRQIYHSIFEKNLKQTMKLFSIDENPSTRRFIAWVSAGLAGFIIEWMSNNYEDPENAKKDLSILYKNAFDTFNRINKIRQNTVSI